MPAPGRLVSPRFDPAPAAVVKDPVVESILQVFGAEVIDKWALSINDLVRTNAVRHSHIIFDAYSGPTTVYAITTPEV